MAASEELMKVFGAKELVDMFQELDSKVQNTILNKSFKKAARILISSAQGNLGGSYRRVQKSLTSTFKKDIQTMSIGASKKKGGYAASWANKGTLERFHKSGKSVGKVVGTYFWDRAITNSEGQMQEAINSTIITEFNKIVQKNKKQT